MDITPTQPYQENKLTEQQREKDEQVTDSSIQIKPSQLSQLLEDHGPLAMRHITNLLSQEIPSFVKMSSSKQRRMIMNALEQGDRGNWILFQKIGWGLWQIERVGSHCDFDKERDLMNILNKRRRDSINSEEKNVDINRNDDSVTPVIIHKQTPKMLYIDEDALDISSDDDNERLIDTDLMSKDRRKSVFSMKRRVSSVVSGSGKPFLQLSHGSSLESPPLLPQRIKPLKQITRSKSYSNQGKKSYTTNRKRRQSATEPNVVMIKPRRSSSTSKESGIRTTLNDSPVSNDNQQIHDPVPRHLTCNEPLSLTNLRGTMSPLDLDQMVMSQIHLDGDEVADCDKNNHSDTEEEDWEHMDPHLLQQQSSQNANPSETTTNTEDAALLLLSLR